MFVRVFRVENFKAPTKMFDVTKLTPIIFHLEGEHWGVLHSIADACLFSAPFQYDRLPLGSWQVFLVLLLYVHVLHLLHDVWDDGCCAYSWLPNCGCCYVLFLQLLEFVLWLPYLKAGMSMCTLFPTACSQFCCGLSKVEPTEWLVADSFTTHPMWCLLTIVESLEGIYDSLIMQPHTVMNYQKHVKRHIRYSSGKAPSCNVPAQEVRLIWWPGLDLTRQNLHSCAKFECGVIEFSLISSVEGLENNWIEHMWANVMYVHVHGHTIDVY